MVTPPIDLDVPALPLRAMRGVGGEVRLPGSKSISNRALLLAALARGETRLRNLLRSDDTDRMLTALAALGTTVEVDGEEARVIGAGGPLGQHSSPKDGTVRLDLGLAGTALRPLLAVLTLGRGRFELDGTARMRERPVAHLVDGLRQLGAEIRYLGEDGFPPVAVIGTGLAGGRVAMRGDVSSQFPTALLMAAALAAAPVTVEITGTLVSRPYLAITTHMMAAFGAAVTQPRDAVYSVQPGGYRSPGDYRIEGDASAASYFLAAGAIRGSGVTVRGIGADSVQGDVAFADVLEAMGAQVRREADSITVHPGPLRGVDLDLNHIPDAAMTLAVLALFAEGPTRIRNVANWRVKETDRLAAMATELRKLGAGVDEGPDSLTVTPPTALRGASIDTYGDHRMAMCFALLALSDAPVVINEPACVRKTFPEFFDTFAGLAR